MRSFFQTLLVLAFITTAFQGQLITQDDHWAVWEDTQTADSLRYSALDELIQETVGANPDSAETLANMLVRDSRQKHNDLWLAHGLKWLARIYDTKGLTLQGMDTLKLAEQLALRTSDQVLIAEVYNSFGILHHGMGNYSLSIEHYLKTLKIHERLEDPNKIERTLRNIGLSFKNIGDHDKSMEYLLRGLAIVKEHGLNHRLPSYYLSLGSIKRNRKEYSEAKDYFNKVVEMGDSISNKKLIAAAYHNLGLTYWAEGDRLDSALMSFEKSYAEKQKIGWAVSYGSSYTGLGGVNNAMGRHKEALPWCRKALEHAKQKERSVVEMNACGCLYETFKGLGQLDSALAYHEKIEVLKNSLIDIDREKEINRKELGYQFEKKALTDSLNHANEQALLVSKTEKQQIGLLAAGGGLLLVVALAFAIYSGKKKSDELLLNILPEETARELKAKGHADAKLMEDVTVLFTDFKGFTALSEQVTPKELVHDLHECFSAFDRICEKHGIEKIKTIGDAYMAAGGIPVENPTHAVSVVNAALEMAKVVEEGKAKKIAAGLPYFEIRIGIHTGPVVAGIVGIKKFQYDIWGDTVNTASRMESSGEVGKVNISQTTYQLVKGQFNCQHRGKVAAKGKGEIDMYFVEKA